MREGEWEEGVMEGEWEGRSGEGRVGGREEGKEGGEYEKRRWSNNMSYFIYE